MSRQNDIDDAIWADPPFHDLTPPSKLVYIWAFTNSRVGMAGIYKVPRGTIAHEVGYDEATVAAALEELEGARFVFYDGTWLWVRSRIKRLRTRTVAMCKSVAKQVAAVPDGHPLRAQLMEHEGDKFWASKDERTTIRAEIDGTPVTPGTHGAVTAPRRNKGYRPCTSREVQGQGQGKRPTGVGVQGEGTDWMAWAAENLPDLPQEFVFGTVARLAGGDKELTPELVRRGVLAAHPHLAQEATA